MTPATSKLCKSIKSLKNNQDIVIKPADKGGAVVIQNTVDYRAEATRQLSDETFYEELHEDPTDDFRQQAEELINEMPGVNVTVPLTPRVSQFYTLPKVHKLPKLVTGLTGEAMQDTDDIIECAKQHKIIPPGRPIVSSVGSVTEPLSHYVDLKLQSFLPKIKSYVKDTTDFLNKIRSVNVSPESTLVTMDVTGLYTNIPHRGGIEAIGKFLSDNGSDDDDTDSDDIQKMVDFILKHNYFEFDGKFYLQKQGTAMGTKMAPAYANVYMAVLEEEFLERSEYKPSLYVRYIDDIFMIWEHGDEKLKAFHEAFNSQTETIKFTMEHSKVNLNFLDVSVSNEDGRLSTSIYRKPTDSFSYLKYESFHPQHIKQSIVFSQMLRFRRIISDEEVFDKEVLVLGQQFVRRGYPPKLIKETIQKVKRKSRDELLTQVKTSTKESRVPLVTTYHPSTGPFVDSVRKEWDTLHIDPVLGRVVGAPPLHAQRQPANLRKMLVRSKMPEPPKPRGNVPCGKARCQICKHIITDASVRISDRLTIKPEKHDCNASNILYCLFCKRCPGVVYVGETSTKFRTRFNNHKSSITNKRVDLPVARHFSEQGHSLSDIKVCLFGGGYKTAEERKIAELRAIVKSRSFESGLNKDLSFLNTFTFFR